jgi:hypothetical protein
MTTPTHPVPSRPAAWACRHCGGALDRARRRRWMRWLFPGSRLYRCPACVAHFLKVWGF